MTDVVDTEVLLGALDLNQDPNALDDDADFWFEVLADGFDAGSPEAVRKVAASLLLDGDQEEITRYGNRQRSFRVRVAGKDIAALDAGEKALALALNSSTTLSFRLPEVETPTVWDVLTGTMSESFDDLAMVAQKPPKRTYAITLTCLPWPRTPDLVVQTVTPEPASAVELDACSSTTLWSSPLALTPTSLYIGGVSEDAIRIGSLSPGVRSFTWNGTVPSDDYLYVDVAGETVNELRPPQSITLNGQPPIAAELRTFGNRYYFTNPGSTPTFVMDFSGAVFYTYVVSFGRASTLPPTGTTVINVQGSQRTQGSLKATINAANLDLFCYGDPTMLTYGWSPEEPDTWANAPAGRYAVWATPGNADKVAVNFQCGSGEQYRSTIVDFGVGGGVGSFVPVDTFELGSTRDGRIGPNEVFVYQDGALVSGVNVHVLIFRLADDASLTAVGNSVTDEETLSTYIDAPTREFPHGGLWGESESVPMRTLVGQQVAWDDLVLTPPLTPIWVTNAPYDSSALTEIELSYYPRSHTYVA